LKAPIGHWELSPAKALIQDVPTSVVAAEAPVRIKVRRFMQPHYSWEAAWMQVREVGEDPIVSPALFPHGGNGYLIGMTSLVIQELVWQNYQCDYCWFTSVLAHSAGQKSICC
jgi:hypothetical protein